MSELTEEQKEAQKAARLASLAKAREARRAKAAAAKAAPRDEAPMSDLVSEMLTQAEIDDIRAQAKAKVIAERKAAARKQLLDEAVEEERRAAGLIPPETEHQRWLAELVEIHVNLPKQGPRDHPTLMIDQRIFHSGRMYTVTRAQAMTMNDMMQRQRWHQAQIKGESRNYYDEMLGAMMYPGGRAYGSGSFA